MQYKSILIAAGFKVDGGITLITKLAPATITTAGAATYTTPQLYGGLILRDPNGASRSDVTPTATAIINALPHPVVGSSFRFVIRNDADGDETITITAGTGVTLVGTMTIGRGGTREFAVRVTAVASPAVTIYALEQDDLSEGQTGISTVTTDTTAGNNTWTADELLGGLMLRDPTGANRADPFPTGALIVAAIPGAVVGSSFEFSIRNTADAQEIITMTAVTGITLSGTMTINRNETRRFLAVVTNAGSPAVTIYNLGVDENSYILQGEITDISSAASIYIAVPFAGKIRKISTALQASISNADAIITTTTSVGAISETITVAQSGSGAGDIDISEPAEHANVAVAAGTVIRVATGGQSTDVAKLGIVIEIERT